jgi:cysteine sulfinate desulfinase/cysteine desulfurase-like protein
MGVPPKIALGAVRFSLGKQNDQQEIDRVVELLASKVTTLRSSALQNQQ